MMRLLAIILTLFILTSKQNAFCNTNYQELPKLNYLFLIDQDTQEVLLAKNATEKISPSSMTKLMTAYIVFQELENQNIELGHQCLIGKDAWRKKGSTMFLNHRDIVSIDELIRGLIIVSGNDSSIALAQSISGSVKSFAKLMNKTAKEIGLKNSNFKNPHGLNQHGHFMTLEDLATLTRRIAEDFPQFMHYFSTTEFTYGNITQKNRNPLIKGKYQGATGMKTGYTTDGGYGVTGTATRGNKKLIAVINNTLTPSQRKRAVIELLDYGFNNFDKITLFQKEETIAQANVWLGKKTKLDLISKKDISINLPIDKEKENLTVEIKYQDPLFTPIKKGQEYATLIIKDSDKIIRELPLYAKEDIRKAGYFSRMWRVFHHKTKNLANNL